jgi:hypothetical protein
MDAGDRPNWAERWRWECEQAAFHAGVLLRLGGRYVTHSAVLEMIRTAPRSPGAASKPEESFFMRCTQDACKRRASYEADLLEKAIDYFGRLANMRPARRAMIEACVGGALIGIGMGS